MRWRELLDALRTADEPDRSAIRRRLDDLKEWRPIVPPSIDTIDEREDNDHVTHY